MKFTPKRDAPFTKLLLPQVDMKHAFGYSSL